MSALEYIKKNAIAFIISILFIAWMIYLGITTLTSTRTIHFYNVLTGGEVVDVSSQYISEIPMLRYFFEPFAGLTFVFAFNSDPTEILALFIIFYVSIRVALIAIDNTILNHNGKKEVVFRYIKDILEFFVKYASIVILIIAVTFAISYFTLGFLFIANYFAITFHYAALLGVILLLGKAIYNAAIYFRPNAVLKIKRIIAKNPVKKGLIRFRRELFYFWTAFLLIFCLNFTFLSIRFPTHHIQAVDLAPDEFLFDFHVHTTMSDGHLTPEQRVLWYIQQGIHGAAFSDHSHPRGAQRAREFVERNGLDFIVLIAQEYTDDPEDIHLNIFGIEVEIIPEGYTEGPYGETRMNCSEMIQWVKANGGYVIVNHYDKNDSAPFSYEQLRDWGVDGFEIAHGNFGDRYQEIRDFCLNNSVRNLTCISGSDIHKNNELNTFVRLKLTDPTNKTVHHIFENLARNNHSCVIMPELNYYSNTPDSPIEGLYAFHNYLSNLDGFQSLSWIIWSCIAYISVMFILRRIKKADGEKLRSKINH